MTAIARHLLAAYWRGRGFVAPGAVAAIGVGLVYAPAPNPVLATAGTAAAFLFFAQAWLALTLFADASDQDRRILAAAAGPRAVALGRLLAGAGLAALVSVLAVAYPVATGRFEHAPGVGEVALCLLATLATTTAATALAALFAPPLVRNRALAALGLALVALATVPLGPAAAATARALHTRRAAAVPARLAPDLAAIGAFVVGTAIACTALWRRAE